MNELMNDPVAVYRVRWLYTESCGYRSLHCHTMNTISGMNNSDFFADIDIDLSWTCSRNRYVHSIMSLNSFPAIPESSIRSSIPILGSKSPRFSVVT